MLLDKQKSCLVVMDVQEKLANKVINAKNMIGCCEWLVRLASELDVPILACEQYPKGLGRTINPLRNLLTPNLFIEKASFSAFSDATFHQELYKLNRKQIVLIGIETHVCILQTALELIAANYQVFIVIDAVSARHMQDHHAGLDRMKQAGAQIITAEMAFYEWVKQAGTEVFKSLNKAFMKMEN